MNLITTRDHALIQKYYLNTISDLEKQELERKLEQSNAFKETFELVGTLSNTLVREEANVLKQLLQKEEEQYKLQTFPQKNATWSRLYWWFIAIGILLGILFLWKFLQPKAPVSEVIYAQYFEPYPNTLVLEDRNSSVTNTTQQAFIAYEKGKFKEAALLFERLSTSNTSDVLFYEAIALLSIQEPKKSITKLQTVLNNPDSRYSEQAKWYLALAFIANNEQEQAIPLLKAIQKSTSSYKQREAEKILIQCNISE